MLRIGRSLVVTRRVLSASAMPTMNRSHIPIVASYRAFSQLPIQPPSSTDNKKESKTTPSVPDYEEAETGVKLSKQQVVINGMKTAAVMVKGWVMNPRQTWKSIKEEAHHYWVGSKLLWSEIQITTQILQRVLKGHELTRRERKQLIRTSTDLFRLIPFAIIVVVPFMELLLPVLLKVFPNMLPSTFEDKARQQETAQKELKTRLAVAKFMQESLQEMASKNSSHDVADVKELTNFIDNARKGAPIPNEKVIQMAKLFKDELTLANIGRPQLLALCRYMGLQTYGADSFLRFQLRTKFRDIKEDDRRILWEGVDSLNILELREACRERGMKSMGLTQFHLKHQLQEWLELSTHKGIPISLLIMSRAFQLTSHRDDPEVVLKSSMSALDSDTINEIVLASASPSAESTTELRMRKLESLKFQQELIQEEIVGADEIRQKLNQERALEEEKKKAEKIKVEMALDGIKPIPPPTSNFVKDGGARVLEESSSDRSHQIENKM